MMNIFERWRSGECAALRYEAASMKQVKNKSNNSMEALSSRAKTLCLQGHFGCAATTLSSEEIAPGHRKTLTELEKFYPVENEIFSPIDYSCKASQFNEAEFFAASVFFEFHSNWAVQNVPRASSPRNQLFNFRSIQASKEFPNQFSELGQQRPASWLQLFVVLH